MSAQGGNANAVNGASGAKFGIDPFETAKGEYTPTTEQVRSHYVFNQSDQWDAERGLAFDRWLAAHDAEKDAKIADLRVMLDAARAFRGADLTARLAAAEATIAEARTEHRWGRYGNVHHVLSAYRPVAAHPEVDRG